MGAGRIPSGCAATLALVGTGAGHQESRLPDAANANDHHRKDGALVVTPDQFLPFSRHLTAVTPADPRFCGRGKRLFAFGWQQPGELSRRTAQQQRGGRAGVLAPCSVPCYERRADQGPDAAAGDRHGIALQWVDERGPYLDRPISPTGPCGRLPYSRHWSNRAPACRSSPASTSRSLAYPAAIELLASAVRSVASDRQVLISTQSPALLDVFDPGEVVVAERHEGATTLIRLVRGGPRELAQGLSPVGVVRQQSDRGAAVMRVLAVVEGRSEELLLKRMVAPHLANGLCIWSP